MSKRCHPLATAGKKQHKTPLTSCTHHRDLLGKAAGNGRTARDSARYERVKLNICNGSIFKTPVGLGLWLSEGSGSRSQKAVGAHDSHAAQKAVGVKHPQRGTSISFPDVFWEGKYRSAASSPVTQQEQELASSPASGAVIFCSLFSSLFVSHPPFFFCKWQTSTAGAPSASICTLFNARSLSQAVPRNGRQRSSLISACNSKTPGKAH